MCKGVLRGPGSCMQAISCQSECCVWLTLYVALNCQLSWHKPPFPARVQLHLERM